jgi:hypothetical protein
VPSGLSADFAALINAINNQGRANREEEKREDRGKSFRDKVNIFILGFTFVALAWTCWAIIQQVEEMRRAYGPLKQQAESAKDTLIISQRAWIDPLFVRLEPPTYGAPIVYRVTYQNVGHSPATDLNWAFDNGFREAEQQGSFERFDSGLNSTCDGLTPDDSGAAIEFPPPQGVSPTDYTPHFLPGRSNGPRVKHKITADLDMINGGHHFYVQGCIVYRTMGIIGKSRFCFSLSTIAATIMKTTAATTQQNRMDW